MEMTERDPHHVRSTSGPAYQTPAESCIKPEQHRAQHTDRQQTPDRMATQVSIMPLPLMLFLGASSFIWPLAPAGGFNLPICQLVNQTVSLEKEGCPTCHRVETTICSGHCFTKIPVMKIRYPNMHQDVCTYQDLYYRTVELPDCLPGVDPTVTYPVALSCHCGGCNMATTDCTFESLQPDFCMNDIPFYL